MTAIHSVLTNKDDRVVTDGLRLADLLVVLLCEGRSSLPYTVVVCLSILFAVLQANSLPSTWKIQNGPLYLNPPAFFL